MVRLDVLKSRELQATIYALRAIDTTIAKQVRQHTKRVAEPEWKEAITRRASTMLERRVIAATATIAVSNQNVRVTSGAKGRPLSQGLNPKTDYPAIEFGAKQKRTSYTRRSKRGGAHTVTRTTGTQLRPRRPGGYVFIPAAQEMIPRLASLWVQTTVRTIGNALEGKQE